VEVAATARGFGGEGDDAAMGRGKLAPPNTRGFELMQHPRNPLLGPKQVHALRSPDVRRGNATSGCEAVHVWERGGSES
jgi:hypothetical protein